MTGFRKAKLKATYEVGIFNRKEFRKILEHMRNRNEIIYFIESKGILDSEFTIYFDDYKIAKAFRSTMEMYETD